MSRTQHSGEKKERKTFEEAFWKMHFVRWIKTLKALSFFHLSSFFFSLTVCEQKKRASIGEKDTFLLNYRYLIYSFMDL